MKDFITPMAKEKHDVFDLTCEELAKTSDWNKFMWKCYADVLLKDNKTRLSLYSCSVGKTMDYPIDVNLIESYKNELIRYLEGIKERKQFTLSDIVKDEVYVDGEWVETPLGSNAESCKRALARRVTRTEETYFTAKNPFRVFTEKFPSRLLTRKNKKEVIK